VEEDGGGGAEDWVGACGWGVCLIYRFAVSTGGFPFVMLSSRGIQGLPWIGRIQMICLL
jgi:hypothetical protein